MPFVDAAGAEIHYVEHGAASGEAEHVAVFLHGFSIDHRMNVAVFEPAFGGRPGWRRIYLDLPGMGRSPASVGLFDRRRLSGNAAAIDDWLPGACVAGGSYGSYLALGVAAADPDRVTGLSLLVTMVADRDQRDVPAHRVLFREEGVEGSELFEEVAVVITAETVRRTEEEIEAAVEVADPETVARLDANYAGSFPLVPPTGSLITDARRQDETLVVTGRQDSITGYADAWRLLGRWPRATFVVLDRAGHNLHIEQPTLLDALVTEWVERVAEYESD